MATILYSINLGQKMSDIVTDASGPALTTGQLEINLDATKFTNTGDLRSYLEMMTDYIVATWKPS